MNESRAFIRRRYHARHRLPLPPPDFLVITKHHIILVRSTASRTAYAAWLAKDTILKHTTAHHGSHADDKHTPTLRNRQQPSYRVSSPSSSPQLPCTTASTSPSKPAASTHIIKRRRCAMVYDIRSLDTRDSSTRSQAQSLRLLQRTSSPIFHFPRLSPLHNTSHAHTLTNYPHRSAPSPKSPPPRKS